MTVNEALEWADKTMNERLFEARRTGTDHDYDAAMEACIDTLAAEVRRLREVLQAGMELIGHKTPRCPKEWQCSSCAWMDRVDALEGHHD